MPTITSNTTDGYQSSSLNASWDAVHDHVGQSNPVTNLTYSSLHAIRYEYVSGRGGVKYYLTRSFLILIQVELVLLQVQLLFI